jgi:hypothetical protein
MMMRGQKQIVQHDDLAKRLSDDGPGASRIVPDGRHPKPFTDSDIRDPDSHHWRFGKVSRQLSHFGQTTSVGMVLGSIHRH